MASDIEDTDGIIAPVRPNDLFIAVMGITGSGKSTFIARGNHINC
jgi:ABC-type lipoprotein export system ATPase subunit